MELLDLLKLTCQAFQLPILEKDALKEEMFDTIGFQNYAEKRKLDIAANAVLIRATQSLLEKKISLILDNNFDTESAARLETLLKQYECNCITLFMGGDCDVFYKRYVERDLAHKRHLGHVLQVHYPPHEVDSLDYSMTREEFREKFEKRGMDQIRFSGKRIDLDATYPEKIDVEALIGQLKELMNEDQ